MRFFQGKIFGIISKDFAKTLYEGLIIKNILIYSYYNTLHKCINHIINGIFQENVIIIECNKYYFVPGKGTREYEILKIYNSSLEEFKKLSLLL